MTSLVAGPVLEFGTRTSDVPLGGYPGTAPSPRSRSAHGACSALPLGHGLWEDQARAGGLPIPTPSGSPGSHLLSQVVPHPEFWSQDSKGEQPPPLPPTPAPRSQELFPTSASHLPLLLPMPMASARMPLPQTGCAFSGQLGRSVRTPLASRRPEASSAPEHNKDHHH